MVLVSTVDFVTEARSQLKIYVAISKESHISKEPLISKEHFVFSRAIRK